MNQSVRLLKRRESGDPIRTVKSEK
ncbi:UNVERIFIED_CONTAM: hypothetical protein NCL1_17568 [Trichonephila clavipes]